MRPSLAFYNTRQEIDVLVAADRGRPKKYAGVATGRLTTWQAIPTTAFEIAVIWAVTDH